MSGLPEVQMSADVQSASPSILIEKRCTKCGKITNIFRQHKCGKDGLSSWCKECEHEEYKKWIKNNPNKKKEYAQKWYKKYSEAVKERSRKQRVNNPEKVKIYKKEWELKNKEYVKNYGRLRREKNKEKINEYRKNWYRENRISITEHRNNNPQAKLSKAMSTAICFSLKGNKSGRKWETLIGFTMKQLQNHLEKKFKEGMTWENYGRNGWHVDHIIPLVVHNYTTPDDIDFKKCWSLKNLQPLWEKENIAKHDKLFKPFQPSLTI